MDPFNYPVAYNSLTAADSDIVDILGHLDRYNIWSIKPRVN